MAVISDDFKHGGVTLEFSEMDDETLLHWTGVDQDAQREYVRRFLSDERSLPPGVFDARHLPGKHNQKDHGKGGPATEGSSPLTGRQYDALRPQRYSRDLEIGTQMELEETEAGRDLVGAIRRHTETFGGCAELSDDVWKVAKGGTTGDSKRDREARALVDSVRHAPADMIPGGKLITGKSVPGRLYRGIAVDNIEAFAEKHKPGSTVELSSTAWSRSKETTRQYSHIDEPGWHPVTVVLETKAGGAKALPVQNLMHYPENHGLEEFITMGQFEVVSYDEPRRGEHELKIRQTGVF